MLKLWLISKNSIAQGLNLYENFHAAFGAAAKILPTGQYSPFKCTEF